MASDSSPRQTRLRDEVEFLDADFESESQLHVQVAAADALREASDSEEEFLASSQDSSSVFSMSASSPWWARLIRRMGQEDPNIPMPSRPRAQIRVLSACTGISAESSVLEAGG